MRYRVTTTMVLNAQGQTRLRSLLHDRGVEAYPVTQETRSESLWEATSEGEIREALALVNQSYSGLAELRATITPVAAGADSGGGLRSAASSAGAVLLALAVGAIALLKGGR